MDSRKGLSGEFDKTAPAPERIRHIGAANAVVNDLLQSWLALFRHQHLTNRERVAGERLVLSVAGRSNVMEQRISVSPRRVITARA